MTRTGAGCRRSRRGWMRRLAASPLRRMGRPDPLPLAQGRRHRRGPNMSGTGTDLYLRLLVGQEAESAPRLFRVGDPPAWCPPASTH